MDPQQLLERLLHGSVGNVRFADLQRLIEACGFELDRVRGSHHIFRHRYLAEMLNLQSVRGHAKPYQIRQFLMLVEKYHLKPKE